MKDTAVPVLPSSQPGEGRAATPSASGGVMGWLADRPWIFVVVAFLVIIGVWSFFITLAIKNSPRDVLQDPLPIPASTPSAPVEP